MRQECKHVCRFCPGRLSCAQRTLFTDFFLLDAFSLLTFRVCVFVFVCSQYIASSWNHDGDPVELLQINESVSQFRQALKENPRFLQDKVKHYFKVNETSTILNMCSQ